MADKPILEKTFNEDLDLDEKLREGGILSRIYLEVQGNDLKAAKKALENTVLDRMVHEPDFHVLEVKMFDLVKEEGQEYYSGVIEIKSVARDFHAFLNVVMRYGPSAIEILSPEEITLKSDEMHAIVGDISNFVATYFANIFSMLKDEERVALYQKMLGESKKK
ncbi:MAG: hypothetical protein FJY77_01800 [Candidatus Altiarchaeales archaeon]|nr:hypothetical protein [Candidatus Altiarchaeales archaeon]